MVGIENLTCRLDIDAILGLCNPRIFQCQIKIIAQNIAFCRTERGLGKPLEFLHELGTDFRCRTFRCRTDFLGIFVDLIDIVIVVKTVLVALFITVRCISAQFCLNDLELFAQVIIALVLFHLRTDLGVDILLGTQNFLFAFKKDIDQFQTLDGIGFLEDRLLIGVLDENIGCNKVCKQSRLLDAAHGHQKILGCLGQIIDHLFHSLDRVHEKRLGMDTAGGIDVENPYKAHSRDMVGGNDKRGHFHARRTVNEHPCRAVGCFDQLLDAGNRTEAEQIIFTGIIGVHFALGHKQDFGIVLCRLLARANPFFIRHLKGDRDHRKDNHTAQRNAGHGFHFQLFCCNCHVYSFVCKTVMTGLCETVMFSAGRVPQNTYYIL